MKVPIIEEENPELLELIIEEIPAFPRFLNSGN